MPVSSDRILYIDDHLLAVSKLAGELVVKGKGEVGRLPLLDFLKKDYPGLRALHRLDFETSGVVLFARTKAAYDKIMETGFDGWRKVYQTLVMGRMERDRGVIQFKLPARGKGLVEALTRYRVLDRYANSSYVECEIDTGRHHQIRLHFQAIKHPLVLDEVYGHKKFNQLFARELKYRRFLLHASCLELPHPITGAKLHIGAPLPDAFASLVKKLGSL